MSPLRFRERFYVSELTLDLPCYPRVERVLKDPSRKNVTPRAQQALPPRPGISALGSCTSQ